MAPARLVDDRHAVAGRADELAAVVGRQNEGHSGPSEPDVANLDGIANGTQALVNGEDYTVSGNAVTIKKEYLAAQPAGTTNLTFSFKGDYMDDVHYTETNGDYFVYGFKGTGIDLIMPMGPNQGEMDVYIDGSLRKTVNAFAEARSSQQTVFSISGLKAGTHSIKVVKKSGSLMLADGLRFTVAGGGK